MTFQHPSNLHHADPAEVRLAKALTDLENERKAVGKIQRSLLPATLPQIPGFAELGTATRPGSQSRPRQVSCVVRPHGGHRRQTLIPAW